MGNLVLHAPARFSSWMEGKIKVVTLYVQQPKGELKLTGFFPTMSFSTFWTWDTWSSLVLSSRLRIRSYIPTSISRGMSSPSSTPVRGGEEKREREREKRGLMINSQIYESWWTPGFTYILLNCAYFSQYIQECPSELSEDEYFSFTQNCTLITDTPIGR